ncbi:MAG: cytochrome c maturation protein CcmE [Pseudomonadota bacterium]
MKPRHKRLAFILIGLAGLGVAATLVLNALKSNLQLFYSPSELAAGAAPKERTFRLGGLVEEGSVKRGNDGLTVSFVLTDRAENVNVVFKGILPDLFKEGQGAVALGKISDDGVFMADEVLAKHDETYMPPEVAKALEQAKKSQPAAAAPINNMNGGRDI